MEAGNGFAVPAQGLLKLLVLLPKTVTTVPNGACVAWLLVEIVFVQS